MATAPTDWVQTAVNNFWDNRKAGAAGARSGKHDKEFLKVILAELNELGYKAIAPSPTAKDGKLAGHFRRSKSWDVLASLGDKVVIAIEFKGQIGSLGNNENNRYEEALGSALDLRQKYSGDIYLGFIYVLGDTQENCDKILNGKKPSKAFLDAHAAHKIRTSCFKKDTNQNIQGLDQAFRDTSHARRREIFAERLLGCRINGLPLYDAAAVLHTWSDRTYLDPENDTLKLAGFVNRLDQLVKAGRR